MVQSRSIEEPLPPAIFIMGPTASGKTDLAIELARQLPVDVISVDSALVYRDMNIGTAKPSAEELAQAPHRLIDIVAPTEAYSAARFRADALREMADITAAGRIPLLAGGTMLYFRALEQGLSNLPQADEAIRQQLLDEAIGIYRHDPSVHYIGLQIMGRHFDEEKLLQVAHQYEQATDFHLRKPKI